MDINRQQKAPIYEALEEFKKRRVVPFDVPGHKRGRGNPELVQLLGQKCVELDVNSMKPLDNLCHPVSDGRCIWRRKCIPHGWGNDIGSAGNDIVNL